jgi:hypothetical protein
MNTRLSNLLALWCVALTTNLCAQSTVVTYQGRVQSGGDDFTGNGQFKFALVTSSNTAVTATATATLSGGFVTIIAVNNGGNGYVTPPAVTISGGGGSGAAATASVIGGAVTAITVNNPGTGYTSAPTVSIAAPPEALVYVTYWSHDGTSSAGSEPASAVSLPVAGGLFTARLGDTAAMSALPAGLFSRPDLRLRLWFNDGVNGFAPLLPAQSLTAAPYAFVAGGASNLLGTVTGSQLIGAYANPLTFSNPANNFSGIGVGLTALNASQLASGTVPDARLGANVPRLNASQTFSGGNTFSGASTFNNPGSTFMGSGAGLTGLNASNLGSGIVPDARLSANVSLLGQTIESTEITDGAIGSADVNVASFNTTFWRVSGNAGTTSGTHFLGTTDGQPLEIKVNGLRALRLEPSVTSPNVIAGFSGNFIRPGDVGAAIGGGGSLNNSNAIYADYGVISGGRNNEIGTNANFSTVGGGDGNTVALGSAYSTIAGGLTNAIGTDSDNSTIGGGNGNTIGDDSPNATIGGGFANNLATDNRYSAIAGGARNTIPTNAFAAFIGGGFDNRIGAAVLNSFFAGGTGSNLFSAISGGSGNRIGTNCVAGTIAGGFRNSIYPNSDYATIPGGYYNYILSNSPYGAIGGGYNNSIAGRSPYTTVAGGINNRIGDISSHSTIGGGTNNTVADGAQFATIPGGADNTASGDYSFAAGRRAQASHNGSFVWTDSQDADFGSASANSVSFRCLGGVRFTGGGATVSWSPGSISWTFSSDRNLKEGVNAVDPQEILDKVSRLPMNEWNYKGHSQRHIGPMAQDFHALFPLNENDKMIDSGDLQGVALAAIQGLNRKVEDQYTNWERKLEQKETEITELKERLQRLEQLIHSTSGGTK